MWILLWAGQPRFWTCGGSVITIGRKDATVVIADDPSISRLHCTITIGVSAVESAAPITFTDSSKYGSTVATLQLLPRSSTSAVTATSVTTDGAVISESPTTLPQGVDWSPSINAMALRLQLGTHGAHLDCVWEPFPVMLQGFAPTTRHAVLEQLQRCGGSDCSDINHCKAVIANSIDPTAVIVGALCLAKPIIGADYLTNVLTRLSPKVPLPALDSSLSLPTTIHSAWGTIAFCDEPAADAARKQLDASVFLPRVERRTIFKGFSFVTIQPPLFNELVQYIGFASGRVVLAETSGISVKANTSAYEAAKPLASRYRGHVLVFTTLAPLDSVVMDALNAHGIASVDYTKVIASVLNVQPLQVAGVMTAAEKEFGAAAVDANVNGGGVAALVTLAPGSRTHHGAPTAAGSAAAVEMREAIVAAAARCAAPLGTKSVADLLPTPEDSSAVASRRRPGHAADTVNADDLEEDLVLPPGRSVALPQGFPCYHEPHSAVGIGSGASGSKQFVKQRCAAQPIKYEEMAVYAPSARDPTTAFDAASTKNGGGHRRAAAAAFAVDADDIVPLHAVMDRRGYAAADGPAARQVRASTTSGTARARAADAAIAGASRAHEAARDAVADIFGASLAAFEAQPARAQPRPSAQQTNLKTPARPTERPPPKRETATGAGANGGGGGIFELDNLY